jgi:hypothetical protein
LLYPFLGKEQFLPNALSLGQSEEDVVGVPPDAGAGLIGSDGMNKREKVHRITYATGVGSTS